MAIDIKVILYFSEYLRFEKGDRNWYLFISFKPLPKLIINPGYCASPVTVAKAKLIESWSVGAHCLRQFCSKVCKNVTNDLACLRVLIAQWVERPTGAQNIVDSNQLMGSKFFPEYFWFEKVDGI